MDSNTVVLSRADAQALDKAVHALAFAVEDVRALTGADNPLLAELARQMLEPIVAAAGRAQLLATLVRASDVGR